MRLFLLLFCLAIVGCTHTAPSQPPGLPPEPWLIELREQTQRTSTWTIIAADGTLFSERVEPKLIKVLQDKVGVDEEVEMHYFHSALLPAEQVQELQAMLESFGSLSDTPYEGPPDGPQIQIAAGPKLVTGGTDAPAEVWAIREKLWHWVRNSPVVHSYTPYVEEPEPIETPDWVKRTEERSERSERPRPKKRPTSRPATKQR